MAYNLDMGTMYIVSAHPRLSLPFKEIMKSNLDPALEGSESLVYLLEEVIELYNNFEDELNGKDYKLLKQMKNEGIEYILLSR